MPTLLVPNLGSVRVYAPEDGLLTGFKGVPNDYTLGKVTDESTLSATCNAHHRYNYVARPMQVISRGTFTDTHARYGSYLIFNAAAVLSGGAMVSSTEYSGTSPSSWSHSSDEPGTILLRTIMKTAQ